MTFLLTYFIFATATLMRVDLVPMQLRQFTSGVAAKPAPAVTIAVDLEGRVFVDREQVRVMDLAPRVKEKLEKDKKTVVYLAIAEGQGTVDRAPLLQELWDRLRPLGAGHAAAFIGGWRLVRRRGKRGAALGERRGRRLGRLRRHDVVGRRRRWRGARGVGRSLGLRRHRRAHGLHRVDRRVDRLRVVAAVRLRHLLRVGHGRRRRDARRLRHRRRAGGRVRLRGGGRVRRAAAAARAKPAVAAAEALASVAAGVAHAEARLRHLAQLRHVLVVGVAPDDDDRHRVALVGADRHLVGLRVRRHRLGRLDDRARRRLRGLLLGRLLRHLVLGRGLGLRLLGLGRLRGIRRLRGLGCVRWLRCIRRLRALQVALGLRQLRVRGDRDGRRALAADVQEPRQLRREQDGMEQHREAEPPEEGRHHAVAGLGRCLHGTSLGGRCH
ncbi:MAG: ExbD/TolR family protein, partial [Phycisphaerales bacterium]